MTTGLAATTLANSWLNMLRGTAFTAPAATYIKQHIGDPGAAGTANAAAMTTRSAVTFSVASAGALALSNSPAFTATATETWSHFSVWDASAAGNLLFTGAWSTARSVVSGDTGTVTSFAVSLAPIAA